MSNISLARDGPIISGNSTDEQPSAQNLLKSNRIPSIESYNDRYEQQH
jgi:hypothetical protein